MSVGNVIRNRLCIIITAYIYNFMMLPVRLYIGRIDIFFDRGTLLMFDISAY